MSTIHVPIQEAGNQLEQLVREAQSGEEIVLTEHEKPVARLVPLIRRPANIRRGCGKHLVLRIADDFDAPLRDFAECER